MTAAAQTLAAVPPTPKNLAEKLAAVMGRLSRIPKNGHNDRFNYDYATEGDVADAVREACAAEGVALIPSVEEAKFEKIAGKDAGKDAGVLCTVRVSYTITDGHGMILATQYGTATDYGMGDKALYKALTGCHKYFLLKTFSLSTGEDADPEREDDAPPRKPRPARRVEDERQDHPQREANAKTEKKSAAQLATMARLQKCWNEAKARGATAEEFKIARFEVCGGDKPSEQMTDAELVALETKLGGAK